MDTTALRVLAIILIANSHLENLYPFRPLAADGLIGNSLFFMLSGLGLSLSLGKHEQPFADWYRRRLRRIYPALWVTVFFGCFLIQGGWRDWTFRELMANFLWPTQFTFVGQIVLFYPVFFLIKSARSRRLEYAVMLGVLVIYLTAASFAYNLHVLSWLFYLQMMLLGGLWSGRLSKMEQSGSRHLPLLGLTMLIYVVVKLGMVTGRIPTNVVVLHALTVAIVFSLLALTTTSTVQSWSRRPRLAPVLGLIAGMTFEIYLVHGFVHENPFVAKLPFPVNLGVFWMATVPLAWVVFTCVTQRTELFQMGRRAEDHTQPNDKDTRNPRIHSFEPRSAKKPAWSTLFVPQNSVPPMR